MGKEKIEEEDDNSISCDFCEKRAVANYQKNWMRFSVNKQGDYGKPKNNYDIEEPVEEDNYHLCKEHEQEFLDGVLRK